MKPPKARKLPSGSWRCEVCIQGMKESFTRPTKEEAQDAALLFKMQHSSEDIERKKLLQKMTLSQAIDSYIETKSNILSASTVYSYRSIQRNRFQSVMHIPLAKVKDWQLVVNNETLSPAIRSVSRHKEDVPNNITELDHAISTKTLKNAWGLVSTVLKKYGIKTDTIMLPAAARTDHEFLDPDEIKAFLEAIKGHENELEYLILLHGLRRSELLALKKSSIKKEKSGRMSINVSGAVVLDENNQWVEKKANKTTLSQRTVPVMIPRLKELLKKAPDGKLCKASGNILYKRLRKVMQDNDLPDVGLHGLRHSFASLCYHLQIPELVTQRWGGWSNSDTVHRIYIHLANQDVSESLQKMDDFYAEFK